MLKYTGTGTGKNEDKYTFVISLNVLTKFFHLHLIFNLLNPYISINILHTVLYTSSKRLSRSICLTIKSFFKWWSFP